MVWKVNQALSTSSWPRRVRQERFEPWTANFAFFASDRDSWFCEILQVLLGQNFVRLLYGQDSNNVMIVLLNIRNTWEIECLVRLIDGSA